jgi:hypothetical protein
LNVSIGHTDFVSQDGWEDWYYQAVEEQISEEANADCRDDEESVAPPFQAVRFFGVVFCEK